jgi:hypothetical protein
VVIDNNCAEMDPFLGKLLDLLFHFTPLRVTLRVIITARCMIFISMARSISYENGILTL